MEVLHQCENPQYELEDLSCSSLHILAGVDLEGEYNDLVRPSFIGSSSGSFFDVLHFRDNELFLLFYLHCIAFLVRCFTESKKKVHSTLETGVCFRITRLMNN